MAPFIDTIAAEWARVFGTDDHFKDLEFLIEIAVRQFLLKFEDSAPKSLESRIAEQTKLCLDEVRLCLDSCTYKVRRMISIEQRAISRRLAPAVKERLATAYGAGQRITGKGSLERQKVRLNLVAYPRHFTVVYRSNTFASTWRTTGTQFFTKAQSKS